MSKYSQDLAKSARRHLETASYLDQAERRAKHGAIAGYLFGVAAECAMKEIMRDSGMRPLPEEQRREDPFYAHLPQLKTMLRNSAHGRRAGDLQKWSADGNFMREWDTDMRYAPRKDIERADIERWRDHAKLVLVAMTAS
jgi:hypothetical protein